MKYLNAEVFKESSKRNKKLLIIGIILLGITILLIYLGIKNENKALPKEIDLNTLVEKENDEEYVYSYVEVVTKPYLFAVYETDGVEDIAKFYFVMDKNNYLYILYMNDSKYKELNVDNIKDNPVKVLGLTKKIPNDIKELAIESYNELMEDEYLTKENFKEYIGFLYLDTITPVNDSSLYYVGAFLSGFFALLIIVIVIVIVVLNKKKISKMDSIELSKIDAEISQMGSSKYSDMKFYLLKEYLVDLRNNLVILKYSDILWAYPFEQRYNGMLINKCIRIKDINNKKYDVASTKLLSKDKDETLQAILMELKEKNPDIILGFNKENKKIIKEKIKESKNNK